MTKTRVASMILGLQALLSPARRVPPEIIAEVFCNYLADERFQKNGQGRTVLCQICRVWRNVAISTPALWASLFIETPKMISVGAARRLATKLHVWLSRSSVLPLSIKIIVGSCTRFYQEPNAPSAAGVVLAKALTPYAYRWKDIYFEGPNSILGTFIRTSVPPLPMLKTLTIKTAGFSQPMVCLGSLDPLLATPSLYSLTLVQSCYQPRRICAAWCRLANLSLGKIGDKNLPLNDCLKVLEQCRALLSCTLVFGLSRSNVTTVSEVELQNLEVLSLTVTRKTHDLEAFFRSLSSPCLHSLTLRFMTRCDDQTWPQMQWERFLSQFVLLRLSLFKVPLSVNSVIRSLSKTPSLTHFMITNWADDCGPVANTLLETLMDVAPMEGASLIPNLKVVGLDCSCISVSMLAAFVMCRRHHKSFTSRLETLIVYSRSRDIHSSLDVLIQKSVCEGLDLRWRCGREE
jgi:hypothetical protein